VNLLTRGKAIVGSLATGKVTLNNSSTITNSAAGAVDIALGTIAGSAADDAFSLTVTDSSTFSSGYANMFHLVASNTGAKTGGSAVSQWNGLAADLTVGETANVNGGYIYIGKSGTPDLSSQAVTGWNVHLAEVGATDYLTNLWLQRETTTKGGLDAFILMSLQGSGVAKTGIYFQGIALPDTFLTIQGSSRDMLTDSEYAGTTKKFLKVSLDGADYAIPLYSAS